ncbi:MAG: phasin family protein [Pseudomonadota bacterium]
MTKTNTKALRDIGAELEAQGRDVAHKIWLAGVGAYGRAYDEAKHGVDRVNEGASEIFEDLVKRGETIESDVLDRISSNERVSKSRERLGKALDVAASFQEKQRERFEARMDRMRAAFGMSRQDDRVAELSAKVDALTEQIAALTATAPAKRAAPRKKAAAKESAAKRVARLSGEVAKTSAKSTAKAKKPAKKAAARKSS